MGLMVARSGLAPSHPAFRGDDGADERLEPVFRRLPYPLLLTSAVLGLLANPIGHRSLRWGTAILALTAVAMIWTFVVLPRTAVVPVGNRRVLGYYVGRLLLAAVLVYLSPWFGIYAWFAYLEAIRYFALRAAFLAIGLTSLIVSASYLGGYPHSFSTFGVWLVLIVGSCLLVGFFATAAKRSMDVDREKRQALSDMRSSNERLQAALAENRGLQAQLIAQAREAGIADERARLAGEIHDTLAQTLTGIITQLEAAARSGEIEAEPRGHVRQASDLARAGLSEARRSLHALRPSQLEGSQLRDAIAATASAFTGSTGIAASVDVNGTVVALANDHEIALLRAAQEALANVERHSHATRVGLTLTYLDDAVMLDVRDDGLGFTGFSSAAGGLRGFVGDGSGAADPGGPAGTNGFGLNGMRDRLLRVSGTLTVETAPGEGTALVASVPRVLRTSTPQPAG